MAVVNPHLWTVYKEPKVEATYYIKINKFHSKRPNLLKSEDDQGMGVIRAMYQMLTSDNHGDIILAKGILEGTNQSSLEFCILFDWLIKDDWILVKQEYLKRIIIK